MSGSPPFSPTPSSSGTHSPISDSPKEPAVGNGVSREINAHIFIDQVSTQFRLSPMQTQSLLMLHEISTKFPGAGGLQPADIFSRIYALASQYGVEQCIYVSIMALKQSIDSEGAHGVFKELQIRLEDNFSLTQDQERRIRQVCQLLISRPARTAYKTLWSDVEKKIQAKPADYRMENIFVPSGQVAREALFISKTKRIASLVRGAFRQDISESLYGPKRCTVDEFSSERANRLRLQGSENSYIIHNVLLRRISWERPELTGLQKKLIPSEVARVEAAISALGVVSLIEDNMEIDDEDLSGSDNDSPGSMKKRKRGTVVQRGDFWSVVDGWFRAKIKAWGKDFAGAQWKSYIDESIRLDSYLFGARTKASPVAPQPTLANNFSTTNDPSWEPFTSGPGPFTSSSAGNHTIQTHTAVISGPELAYRGPASIFTSQQSGLSSLNASSSNQASTNWLSQCGM